MNTPTQIIKEQSVNYTSDGQIILQVSGMTQNAVNLSKVNKMLEDSGGLRGLSKWSFEQIKEYKLSSKQSASILASFEVGKRTANEEVKDKKQVRSSKDAYHVLAPKVMDLPHEEFWVAYLNRANRIMKVKQISKGGVAGCVVDAKIIFKHALELLASGIILCHNHPSGNLNPSRADLQITKKLKTAGQALEINVLDHLIITDTSYRSLADEG